MSVLAKEIFEAIVSQIPVLQHFKGSLWTAISGNEDQSVNLRNELEDYCEMLENSGLLDASNPGSSKSAVHDLKSIFCQVVITPDLIVDLNFCEHELLQHYLTAGEQTMHDASSLRRSFIEKGLRIVARSVIFAVVDEPEYKAKVFNRLLTNTLKPNHIS